MNTAGRPVAPLGLEGSTCRLCLTATGTTCFATLYRGLFLRYLLGGTVAQRRGKARQGKARCSLQYTCHQRPRPLDDHGRRQQRRTLCESVHVLCEPQALTTCAPRGVRRHSSASGLSEVRCERIPSNSISIACSDLLGGTLEIGARRIGAVSTHGNERHAACRLYHADCGCATARCKMGMTSVRVLR